MKLKVKYREGKKKKDRNWRQPEEETSGRFLPKGSLMHSGCRDRLETLNASHGRCNHITSAKPVAT